MRHFPAFLDLKDRVALVLGEGEAADTKAGFLSRAGATLRRAARYSPELLENCAVAVGAGAAEEDLRALSAACKARAAH